MSTPEIVSITVSVDVLSPRDKVWKSWTEPDHIVHWCNASVDWHTPHATNDVRIGGKFVTRMEAVDGSEGFDFEGEYVEVTPLEHIEYQIIGGRVVTVDFVEIDGGTRITETFDSESTHSIEQQRIGWQSILDNFKKYTESLGS